MTRPESRSGSPPPASSAAAACPLCAAGPASLLFERRNVPVLLNRLYDSAAAARGALTANLRIAACDRCGFVFNSAFDPSLIGYDSRYENDQGNSPAFSAHMSRMADRILGASVDRADIAVVEIGCGQARFLAALVERAGPRIAAAFGYDPAWRGEPSTPPIRIVPRLFDPQALRRLARPVDVILSRHVIEHLPDPVSFLRGIREALPASWPGRLFLETPSLEWIVDGRVLHDFFHEHCNYFTATALDCALARAGFRALRIDRVFGGQYLWAEAAADQPDAAVPGHRRRSALSAGSRFLRGRVRGEVACYARAAQREGQYCDLGCGSQGCHIREHAGSALAAGNLPYRHQFEEAEPLRPGHRAPGPKSPGRHARRHRVHHHNEPELSRGDRSRGKPYRGAPNSARRLICLSSTYGYRSSGICVCAEISLVVPTLRRPTRFDALAMLLSEASIDAPKHYVVSSEPIAAHLTNDVLTAKRLEVLDDGDLIRFDRGVQMALNPGLPTGNESENHPISPPQLHPASHEPSW